MNIQQGGDSTLGIARRQPCMGSDALEGHVTIFGRGLSNRLKPQVEKNAMITLQPGLYALLAMLPTDDTNDAILGWSLNFADQANRNAEPVYATDAPAGGFVIETEAEYTGHSVMTPFGPLTSSEMYAIVPVQTSETNFLPNLQEAYNWIVIDIMAPTTVHIEGSVITIGETSFDVEDTESDDDCPGTHIPAPQHALADVGFSVVDEDFIEVASFTAADPEYGAISFLFKAPRLDYDLQHITIDDAQRTTLAAMGTPVAKALLACWDERENSNICLMLRKDAPTRALAQAA